MGGPCSWPVSYAGYTGGAMPEPLASMPASGAAVFEAMAVEYLWNWTGQSLGECEVTIRPCRQDCGMEVPSTYWGFGPVPGYMGMPWYPVLINGRWENIRCGVCGLDGCSCNQVASLTLPGPVAAVSAVTIDGVPLLSTAYRVDNARFLVREDGGIWPRCNDLSKPAGEVGTWTVTYTRGVPVPDGGQIAAGVLAVELAKAAIGDKACQLPRRLQTITREGVTVAMIDPFKDVDQGRTGIWLIDSWVASQTKTPTRSRTMSPDVRRPRRTTSP